jgi:hypothetical protein
MQVRPVLGVIALAVAGSIVAAPCRAGHHLWRLTQVFSNANGTVQFVQLQNNTTDPAETGMNGVHLTVGGRTFQFPADLSGSTANKWVLVATSSFASLPGGVTPDYVLPAGFLPAGGGSLTYGIGTTTYDSWTFGTLPTDGVHALLRDGTTPVNSAINFAGQTGSVVASTSVPAVPRWGIILLVGGILLAASGLLRIRDRAGRARPAL